MSTPSSNKRTAEVVSLDASEQPATKKVVSLGVGEELEVDADGVSWLHFSPRDRNDFEL